MNRSSTVPGRPGSSPHTRGALTTPMVKATLDGIIPAYAGCTKSPAMRPDGARDHPRIRGVHDREPREPMDTQGSSPHTRGALVAHPIDSGVLRIIPAYAGCTSRRHEASLPQGDHPRIRGVHGRRRWSVGRWGGSSPHTRGALDEAVGLGLADRIIPAYAGCTPVAAECLGHEGDHPRIRGVHPLYSSSPRVWGGSSPHTRGAQINVLSIGHPVRIIPAYAGCTNFQLKFTRVNRDHPRIRGVHVVACVL